MSKREDHESVEWCHLTQNIVRAPGLLHPRRHSDKSRSGLLFDDRLSTLIREYSNILEFVIISHIPLSRQGLQVTEEDSEARCWIHGEAEFDSTSTQNRIGVFFDAWIRLIRRLHDKRETLFLHPYLFDQHRFEYSAPQYCVASVEGSYDHTQYLQDDEPLLVSDMTVDTKYAYHHTSKIAVYGQSELQKFWEYVDKRINSGKISAKEDAKKCLLSMVRECRDLICTWLYQGKPGNRAACCYVCPTALLTDESKSQQDYQIASSIVGIFWLTMVAKNSKWGKRQKSAAQDILNATWLIVLSDHLHRKHTADIQRGAIEGTESALFTVAHDMSKLVEAIKPENPPVVLDSIRLFLASLIKEIRFSEIQPNKGTGLPVTKRLYKNPIV